MIRALFWLSLLGITVASLVPVAVLPPQAFDVWDKAQHAIAFGWLAFIGLISYPAQVPRVLTGLILYGGAIELAQAATGWRYGEWADLAADVAGIVLGGTIWLPLRPRRTART